MAEFSAAIGSHYVNRLILFVNGIKVEITNPDPEITLLTYLRHNLRLPGSKLGCGEGGCGSCTVMVSKYDSAKDLVEHIPVNACLASLCSLHGQAVTTVEGIGSTKSKLHPVQRQIAENHGSQCGFCTPGIVMSMYTLLRNNPRPTKLEIQENFDGNLCRCTGYRPILGAFHSFAKDKSPSPCAMGENCCRRTDRGEHGQTFSDKSTTCLPYDESQEPIFPPELKLRAGELQSEVLRFESDRVTWFSPTTLTQLLAIRKLFPDSKLINGNTEIGIDIKLKGKEYPERVSVARTTELMTIAQTDKGIRIGASSTLQEVDALFKEAVAELPEWQTRVFAAFIEMLRWFAGHQIRAVACMTGNIITASPISDLNPLLVACRAELDIVDLDGNHSTVVMDDTFFTTYRKTRLQDTDTVVGITVPYTTQSQFFYGYKQANRKEDDIAVVNAGMWVELEADGHTVRDIRLVFGGMADKTVEATKTKAKIIGRVWDNSLLELACSEDMLPADLPLPPGAVGGMVAYRRTLTLSFFFRFYLAVASRTSQISDFDTSGLGDIVRGVSSGCQVYDSTDYEPSGQTDDHSINDALGRPLVHRSAFKQVTGEALYVDDIPSDGHLFVGFVTGRYAHAQVVSIDATKALGVPGVVGFVSSKDVPGSNAWDSEHDLVFVPESGTVEHEGQVIGLVIAENLASAQRAARLVEVTYNKLEPVITIQDAIAKCAFFPINQVVECGDVQSAFGAAERIVEGELHMEAQEHFYLEPHSCIVYPCDADEYQVVCMTQGLDSIQTGLARVLNVKENQINVSVKRIGGGFGGKETRHASVVFPTAVAAYKLQRPVRAVLERSEDMKLTGTRHPVLAKYKVGFTNEGQLTALEIVVYFNCGMSLDLSAAVSERCLLTIANGYNIANVRLTSKLCRTHVASATAFRGFGTPQALFIVESIVGHVACELDMDPVKIREQNFFSEGDKAPYGQEILQNNLLACWRECQQKSSYDTLRQSVDDFNAKNQWKKRGVALSPLTYGIGFPLKLLNKGSALVNIYRDGSVILLTGGVEMGQGLHTKMIQIASRVLDVGVNYIRINETTTNSVPNASPTAGSLTSDLIGGAVKEACEQISQRLAPYRVADDTKSWEQIVSAAIDDRICLSAVGFYKPHVIGMDWSKRVNTPFQYYSFGAACSLVEVDCLTGDHHVLRTDIVMDVGRSLNPAIDVGQIEGAFIQGYGLMCLEQYKVTKEGSLLTQGPGTYKIPGFSDIPESFNVSLLKTPGNPKAVYSSKAIGEPPLCLAVSVFMAIKSALLAARKQNGKSPHFRLDSPATPDAIRLAVGDQFSGKFSADDAADKKSPFFVQL
ncbi:unnamed protein product [Lymnaea stagnalis]|uniref:xanthine dehydrogenase n=1 Tax=Lymnaea stagnalis TaxID=6523 RepID=A0AAV2I0L2_LYMST